MSERHLRLVPDVDDRGVGDPWPVISPVPVAAPLFGEMVAAFARLLERQPMTWIEGPPIVMGQCGRSCSITDCEAPTCYQKRVAGESNGPAQGL